MHAFLIFCVLIEAGFIGLLLWNARRQAIGADATSERIDSVISEITGKADAQSTAAAIRAEAADRRTLANRFGALERQVGTAAAETLSALKALEALIGAVDGQMRGLLAGNTSAVDAQAKLILDIESRVSDLAEGCAKLDADLSTAAEDIRECVRLRQSDLMGINERIAEIVDAQEKARRKSGLRNAPAAFESLRAVAESAATKHPDPEHRKLVALAEGEQ